MTKYTANTSASSEKSKAELERILTRYGANRFIYSWRGDNAVVAFEMLNRQIRFVLPLPDSESKEFTHTPTAS